MDQEFVQNMVKKISAGMIENIDQLERGVEIEHLKVLDLMGSDLAIPTESGLPVFIITRLPTVAYVKTEVKIAKPSRTEPVVEFKVKGVIDSKRLVHARVVSSINNYKQDIS